MVDHTDSIKSFDGVVACLDHDLENVEKFIERLKKNVSIEGKTLEITTLSDAMSCKYSL